MENMPIQFNWLHSSLYVPVLLASIPRGPVAPVRPGDPDGPTTDNQQSSFTRLRCNSQHLRCPSVLVTNALTLKLMAVTFRSLLKQIFRGGRGQPQVSAELTASFRNFSSKMAPTTLDEGESC